MANQRPHFRLGERGLQRMRPLTLALTVVGVALGCAATAAAWTDTPRRPVPAMQPRLDSVIAGIARSFRTPIGFEQLRGRPAGPSRFRRPVQRGSVEEALSKVPGLAEGYEIATEQGGLLIAPLPNRDTSPSPLAVPLGQIPLAETNVTTAFDRLCVVLGVPAATVRTAELHPRVVIRRPTRIGAVTSRLTVREALMALIVGDDQTGWSLTYSEPVRGASRAATLSLYDFQGGHLLRVIPERRLERGR